jgi:catechol 2,3-dioxygenase-like lactoylglutathione lyase family enzyme
VGAADWMGDGPQTWNFGAEGAGSIVDGNRTDWCLVPPVGQGQDQLGDEGKVSLLEPPGLAHRDSVIQVAALEQHLCAQPRLRHGAHDRPAGARLKGIHLDSQRQNQLAENHIAHRDTDHLSPRCVVADADGHRGRVAGHLVGWHPRPRLEMTSPVC